MNLVLRTITNQDVDAIKLFTDRWIGKNYYGPGELEQIITLSQGTSLGAFTAERELGAIRLSLAPGVWIDEATRGLSIDKWKVEPENMAYFKSLFVAKKFQAEGLGKKLSLRSIELLKAKGAQAVLCHSWLESPNNSSQRYLLKMGFEPVNEFPKFWYPIDYQCTRCAPRRCECTAIEMVKYI